MLFDIDTIWLGRDYDSELTRQSPHIRNPVLKKLLQPAVKVPPVRFDLVSVFPYILTSTYPDMPTIREKMHELKKETRFFFVPREFRRRLRPGVERALLRASRIQDNTIKPRLPDGSERIYFYHIRKASGTSVCRSFLSLGGEEPTAVEYRMAESFFPRATSNGLVFATGNTKVLEDGNYFFASSHLPAHKISLPERTFTFTVFRDPVIRVISYYRYLVAGDKNDEAELKQEDGGDLMMYGYGRLSQTLLAHHLIDEIRFSIHPVLVGGGAAGGGNGKTLPLKLLGATPAPNGVVALTYQPASS